MKDLLDIHLGEYIKSILIEALKEYNIKYNITK